jgi:hypothetical protein
VSVLERDRPGYQALGIHEGSFTLFPSIETGLGFSDNILATRTNTESDGYFMANPSLTAQSNWSTNAVSAAVGGQFQKYFSHATEDEVGGFGRVDGELDIDRENNLTGEIAARRTFEERDSGDYPVGAAAPLAYDQEGFTIRGTHEAGRVKAIVSTDFNNLTYDSVDSLAGGKLDESFRDQQVYRVATRGEYAFTPDTSAFVQVGYSRSNYTADIGPGIPNRNSNAGRFLVGGAFDITALLRGYVGLGYESRQYDSNFYGQLSGFAGDARLEYFPTQLTTFTLQFRRLIQDSIILNSGGYFSTGVNLRVDHELLRNLLLNAQIDYERDSFQNIDRNDDIYVASFGAKYLVSSSVGLNAGLTYTNRGTAGTVQGLNFNETRFLVSVVLQR